MKNDFNACQYHNNCGGWCETEKEIEMNLCCDCLISFEEDEEEQRYIHELATAFQKIAVAIGVELASPSEVADIVCAKLKNI